jgi:hypothetical protein
LTATAEVAGPFKVEAKPYVITAKAVAAAPVSRPTSVSVGPVGIAAPQTQVKRVFALGSIGLLLVGIVIVISIVVGIVLAVVLLVGSQKRRAT